jgi:heparan-alpha-glucosaminide N-acetyltransferase
LIVLIGVAVHTSLTFLLEVPGCPRGYLGPGGAQKDGSYFNCTGGAASYIDRTVLGVKHIYQNPTCKKFYDTDVPHDPEGILGCLTSILMVYLGVQAGKILITYPRWQSRTKRWLCWSVITGSLGLFLCKASLNDGWIPINKNLWSLSFVLSMASTAFILLTVLYLVIDVVRWWSGAPFFYAGMNSILLYVGHEVTPNMFPWSWTVTRQTHVKLMFVNLWCTSLWVITSIWLYSVKFFLKV